MSRFYKTVHLYIGNKLSTSEEVIAHLNKKQKEKAQKTKLKTRKNVEKWRHIHSPHQKQRR